MKGNKPASVRRFVLRPKEAEKLSQPCVHLHNYTVLLCCRKALANTAMQSGGQGNAGEQPMALCTWRQGHGGAGNHRDHLCAGNAVPWAQSQRNRDVRGISSVWGRKMSCSCPAASRECSTPSSCSSKGRLKILSWLVLSKTAQGEDSPKN